MRKPAPAAKRTPKQLIVLATRGVFGSCQWQRHFFERSSGLCRIPEGQPTSQDSSNAKRRKLDRMRTIAEARGSCRKCCERANKSDCQ